MPSFKVYDKYEQLKNMFLTYVEKTYRKLRNHDYTNPGDEYLIQYKTDETLNVSASLQFITPQESVIKALLNVTLAGEDSIAWTNNSESPLKFFNIDSNTIMNALGENGIMMGVFKTDFAYVPTVVTKTLTADASVTVTQQTSNDPINQSSTSFPQVYQTQDVYEIIAVPQEYKFLLLTTNLGFSNYASLHYGFIIPAGPEDVFQLDNSNNIVIDFSKIAEYLSTMRPENIATISVDKGNKLIILNTNTDDVGHQTQNYKYTVPQNFFDGTPIVPEGASPTDFIMDRGNRSYIYDMFSVNTNTGTSYSVSAYPFPRNIPLLTAYKNVNSD